MTGTLSDFANAFAARAVQRINIRTRMAEMLHAGVRRDAHKTVAARGPTLPRSGCRRVEARLSKQYERADGAQDTAASPERHRIALKNQRADWRSNQHAQRPGDGEQSHVSSPIFLRGELRHICGGHR